MTRNEAGAVVAILAATWPRTELTEPTIERYLAELESWPSDVGHQAALDLGRTDEYFPTLRRLIEACNAASRVQHLDGTPRALDEAPLPPEQQLANVARVRKLLSRIGKRVPS